MRNSEESMPALYLLGASLRRRRPLGLDHAPFSAQMLEHKRGTPGKVLSLVGPISKRKELRLSSITSGLDKTRPKPVEVPQRHRVNHRSHPEPIEFKKVVSYNRAPVSYIIVDAHPSSPEAIVIRIDAR